MSTLQHITGHFRHESFLSIICTVINNLIRATKKQNIYKRKLTQHKKWQEKTRQEPDLVALYHIQPGNGAGLFFQPQSSQGVRPAAATLTGQ